MLAGALQAGTVGYNFSGTVTSVTGQLEPGFAGLGPGGKVAGSILYDTAAVNSGTAIFGLYDLKSMFLQAGPFSYSPFLPAVAISLQGGYYWDAGSQSFDHAFALEFKLDDTIAPFVQSDALLRPPPDPATVDTHEGTLTIFHSPEPNIARLNFNIDSVSACAADAGGAVPLRPCFEPASVPEPGTLALLGLVCPMLFFAFRRAVQMRGRS